MAWVWAHFHKVWRPKLHIFYHCYLLITQLVTVFALWFWGVSFMLGVKIFLVGHSCIWILGDNCSDWQLDEQLAWRKAIVPLTLWVVFGIRESHAIDSALTFQVSSYNSLLGRYTFLQNLQLSHDVSSWTIFELTVMPVSLNSDTNLSR